MARITRNNLKDPDFLDKMIFIMLVAHIGDNGHMSPFSPITVIMSDGSEMYTAVDLPFLLAVVMFPPSDPRVNTIDIKDLVSEMLKNGDLPGSGVPDDDPPQVLTDDENVMVDRLLSSIDFSPLIDNINDDDTPF